MSAGVLSSEQGSPGESTVSTGRTGRALRVSAGPHVTDNGSRLEPPPRTLGRGDTRRSISREAEQADRSLGRGRKGGC